jgi:3-(3-hydroxy-phenyl)propionate hydroxylase
VTERVSVAVIGAGPTGITAAALLARHGVDCLVLDRWTEVFPQPRAVHLDDEIYRLLGQMGLDSEFAAISRPSRGLRLLDPGHKVLAEFVRSQDQGIHGFPQASMFDQPDFERVLRHGLARQPSARFRGNVEVTGIVRHEIAGDGAVTVELTDRDTGEPDAVFADYVLGCDGANSLVRDAIGARMTDLGFQQRWLVIDIATGIELGQWEGVHQVCSPERAATYMRIGEDRYRWEFQLLDGESPADFGSAHELRPLLRPWIGETPAEELKPVRITDYTFHARIADRWRAGPVFLLGDAAHLTPPFIGQGMGAGLRDAANLSWKLAGVLRSELPESILDSYRIERRPHAETMIRRAVSVGRIMTGGGRAGNFLRRTLAPTLHRIPGMNSLVLDSATPPLRRSTLVRTAPVRRGLAGRQCPNAPLEGATRFDDHVGRRFALVCDHSAGAAQRRAAEQAGVVVVEVAPADPLGQWLADAGTHTALVRPDRTVLAAGAAAQRALRSGVVCGTHPPTIRRVRAC